MPNSPAPPVTAVKHKIAKGAAWMVALNFTMRSLGMISTIILARLLIPADFGLVAMASALVAVVELLGAFNFQIALIHNQDAPRSHYDTVWTLQVILAAVVGLILVALAGPVAEFYAEPRLTNVIYFIAVGTVISGAENVGVVAFRKELEFHREFVFGLTGKIAGFVVAIPLAFYWQNYWALVAGVLGTQVTTVLASYLMHPFRPKPSLSASRELFHFSKWLLLNNVIYVFRHRVADFVIGKIAGARQLGVFRLSYEIASLATTELAAPIDRAVLPGLARMSADLHALRDGYFSAIGMIALIGVPAAVGISATADILIPVAFGAKWADVIPVVQLLAIGGSVSILASGTSGVFIALSRPKLLTLASGIYVLILLPLLLFLTPRFGNIGAASAFLATAILSLPFQLLIVLRLLRSGPGEFIAAIWRPAVAAAVMYVAVTSIASWRVAAVDLPEQFGHLVVSLGVGGASYVTAVLVLWQVAGRPASSETAVFSRLVPLLSKPIGRKRVAGR